MREETSFGCIIISELFLRRFELSSRIQQQTSTFLFLSGLSAFAG